MKLLRFFVLSFILSLFAQAAFAQYDNRGHVWPNPALETSTLDYLQKMGSENTQVEGDNALMLLLQILRPGFYEAKGFQPSQFELENYVEIGFSEENPGYSHLSLWLHTYDSGIHSNYAIPAIGSNFGAKFNSSPAANLFGTFKFWAKHGEKYLTLEIPINKSESKGTLHSVRIMQWEQMNLFDLPTIDGVRNKFVLLTQERSSVTFGGCLDFLLPEKLRVLTE